MSSIQGASFNYQHAPGRYSDLLKNGKVKKKTLKESKSEYKPNRHDLVYVHFDAKDRKTGKTVCACKQEGGEGVSTEF